MLQPFFQKPETRKCIKNSRDIDCDLVGERISIRGLMKYQSTDMCYGEEWQFSDRGTGEVFIDCLLTVFYPVVIAGVGRVIFLFNFIVKTERRIMVNENRGQIGVITFSICRNDVLPPVFSPIDI